MYSYFRYTGRLFLGCPLFAFHCKTIRGSSKTKKERLSYRKKYIEVFVWVISLLWLHALLCIPFRCFLHLSTPSPLYIGMGVLVVFCAMIFLVNNRNYENLLQFNATHFLCKQCFFFKSASVLHSFFMNWFSNFA